MEGKSFYIQEEFTGDYAEISELFSSEGDSIIPIWNPIYLKWQYGANPQGKAIISCAREKETDKLVGVYIVNPVDLWFNGKIQKSALSLNTFSHKDHRGQGMFTVLAKTCYKLSEKKKIESIIGFPNKMSYKGFVKKLGFKDIGTVPYLVKPLNYFNLAKNILLKSKTPSDLSVIKMNSNKLVTEIDINNLEQLDTFFHKHREQCLFQTYRTAAHYRWRFFEHPLNEYKVFTLKNETNQISSVLIIRSVSGATNDIQIVDFCCLDEKSGFDLIQFVIKASKSKFSFIRVFAQRATLEFKVLSKLDFVPKEKFSREESFLPFIYRTLQEDEIEIPFNEWHLSMADSDVV